MKMKIKTFLLTALAASALAVGTASAAPITVPNFSFESDFTSDPATGWAVSAGAWGQYYFTGLLTPPVTDGVLAAYSGGPAVMYQILPTTVAAGDYTIRVDVGRRSDDLWVSGVQLGVYSSTLPSGPYISLGDYTLPSDPPLGGWSTLTATFTVPTGADAIGGRLQLNLASPGSQTVLDNVRVDFVAVPEPSTWVLLALGLTVVVTLRRRTA